MLTAAQQCKRRVERTQIHDVVATNGAVVDDNVPCPKRHGIPLEVCQFTNWAQLCQGFRTFLTSNRFLSLSAPLALALATFALGTATGASAISTSAMLETAVGQRGWVGLGWVAEGSDGFAGAGVEGARDSGRGCSSGRCGGVSAEQVVVDEQVQAGSRSCLECKVRERQPQQQAELSRLDGGNGSERLMLSPRHCFELQKKSCNCNCNYTNCLLPFASPCFSKTHTQYPVAFSLMHSEVAVTQPCAAAIVSAPLPGLARLPSHLRPKLSPHYPQHCTLPLPYLTQHMQHSLTDGPLLLYHLHRLDMQPSISRAPSTPSQQPARASSTSTPPSSEYTTSPRTKKARRRPSR
jgi:hypothetical protein